MKVAYYHTFLTENDSTWLSIVMEQYKVMEDAGLFEQLDEFNLICVGKSEEQFNKILHLTDLYHPNVTQHYYKNDVRTDTETLHAVNTGSNDLLTENLTLRHIYEDVKGMEDAHVLYFHTKGVTSTMRHFTDSLHEVNLFRTYQYWRHYLNYGVLERWKTCVDALDAGYDVAGINFQFYPHPHFSGNFWWAKSSHLAALPDPSTYDWWDQIKQGAIDPWLKQASNRFADEHWICGKSSLVYDVCPGIPNPANVYTKRERYT